MEFTQEIEDKIFSFLLNNDILILWGANNSVEKIAQKVEKVFLIEHNKENFEKYNNKIKNDQCFYYPQETSEMLTENGEYHDFVSYIDVVINIGQNTISKAIINGMAKLECAKTVLYALKNDSIVFITNENNESLNEHTDLLHFYNKADEIKNLYILTPKKQSVDEDCQVCSFIIK